MKLQRFGLETLQHPPYSPELSPWLPHFLATWRKTFVDVCFIRTMNCKSGWGCGSISDLPLSTRLVSQWDKCINTSGNYFWIKQTSLSLCSGCSISIWMPLIRTKTITKAAINVGPQINHSLNKSRNITKSTIVSINFNTRLQTITDSSLLRRDAQISILNSTYLR